VVKWTNKNKYPDYIVKLAQEGSHQPEEGIFGVTSLIGPPAIRRLRMTRWDDIETDVDDHLQALKGRAWHEFLQTQIDGATELPLAADIEGVRVRGVVDCYRDETITDHKTIGAYSFVFPHPEWEQQLNVYAWLARKNGYPVGGLKIDAYLEGWSLYESYRNKDYPRTRFVTITKPLWSEEKQEEFIQARLRDHAVDRECTPEEKWRKADTWAVKKSGNKRALKVYDSPEEAKAHAQNQKGLTVEFRPGSCKRCEEWCIARSVCPWR